MLKKITIRPVLNGFVVSVGCQELAYSNRHKLLNDLNAYLHDPEGTEKRIIKEDGINARFTMASEAEMAPMTTTDCGGVSPVETLAHAVRATGDAGDPPTPPVFARP